MKLQIVIVVIALVGGTTSAAAIAPPSDCAATTDCGDGEYCFFGRCQIEHLACAADQDCYVNETCHHDVCMQRQCRVDDDCSTTMACDMGICVVERKADGPQTNLPTGDAPEDPEPKEGDKVKPVNVDKLKKKYMKEALACGGAGPLTGWIPVALAIVLLVGLASRRCRARG